MMKISLFVLLSLFSVVGTISVSAIPYSTFGIGLSQYHLSNQAKELFSYNVSEGSSHGVMTHFWCTGDHEIDTSIFSYYIDGESTPSIVFTPFMVVGAGWVDQFAPWGNRWFGKGAALGGWYNNFPIPFQKSIRVTGQLSFDGINPSPDNSTTKTLYILIRGSENILPYRGSYIIPGNARLHLQKIINRSMKPLEYLNIVDLSEEYSGVIWFHALQVQSGTKNFMEGCYHLFTPPGKVAYPGLIVATGTEDYYDSAYYFNAGQFRQENAGLTHIEANDTNVLWAAYKMNEVDPLFFNNGVQLVWRNGDVTEVSTGLKCTSQTGRTIANPTQSNITSYAWVYTW